MACSIILRELIHTKYTWLSRVVCIHFYRNNQDAIFPATSSTDYVRRK